MRLLITTDTVGGVWTYSGDLARGMLERGAVLLLVSVGRAPDEGQQAWLAETSREWPETFQTLHVNGALEWMEDGADAFARSEEEMLSICSNFGPDLLHCNQFCYGALPLPRGGRPVPKVVVAHSDVLSWWRARYGKPMPGSAWRSAYIRQVEAGLAGADLVVAPSEASLHDLRESFRFASRTRVIPNGRTTASSALSDMDLLAGKRLRAMTCGRTWDEGKNVGLLERVKVCPLPVLIAGERSLPAAGVASTVRDTAYEESRCIGPLSPDAIEELMRTCAIYVVTSRYEPFGLAAVEAALAGCAVVASALASLREVWGDVAMFFPQ